MSTQIIEINNPPVELETRALSIPEQANALVIADQQSYNAAAAFLQDVVIPMRKEIEETFDPICDTAHNAWKTATSKRKRHLDPVTEAERSIKERLGNYTIQRQRMHQEAERIARAEQERLLAEMMEAEIEQAEARGATAQEVAAIIDTPIAYTKPSVPQTFQKAAGLTARKTYKADVFDLRMLCRAIAEGKAPVSLVTAHEPTLNAMARAHGHELARHIPGVRAVEITTVAAGNRR